MTAPVREAEPRTADWPRFHNTPAKVAGELVYAVGDVHGRYDLLTDMLRMIVSDAKRRLHGRMPA